MKKRKFTVDRDGIIIDQNEFEGEKIYVPYFWDIYKSEGADFKAGKFIGFFVGAADREQFPELKEKTSVILVEDKKSGLVMEASAMLVIPLTSEPAEDDNDRSEDNYASLEEMAEIEEGSFQQDEDQVVILKTEKPLFSVVTV